MFFYKILYIFILLSNISHASNLRIVEEKKSPLANIPLNFALGDKAYNAAINSEQYIYVGNTKCRLCHRKFFRGRKNDQHDFTMDRLMNTNDQNNKKCLPCHTTGYKVPTGFINLEKTSRLANVQCEGCHGPGNVHISHARKTGRGGELLAGPDKPKILKKMCKSCHTQRWNRSYKEKNFHNVYRRYKNPNPNNSKY